MVQRLGPMRSRADSCDLWKLDEIDGVQLQLTADRPTTVARGAQSSQLPTRAIGDIRPTPWADANKMAAGCA